MERGLERGWFGQQRWDERVESLHLLRREDAGQQVSVQVDHGAVQEQWHDLRANLVSVDFFEDMGMREYVVANCVVHQIAGVEQPVLAVCVPRDQQ